ncbi:MAG: hypothetical protein ACK56I_13695, partial [bacterium]
IQLDRMNKQGPMELWVKPRSRREVLRVSNQLFPAFFRPYMFFLIHSRKAELFSFVEVRVNYKELLLNTKPVGMFM